MSYSLVTSYVGESLLSGFNWFNAKDPSNGFVAYQSRSKAEDMGLYSVDEDTGVVRLGVDSRNKYSLKEGRPSIRLESKQAYNHGLFIADFLHMPPSECGLWPAFWTYGEPWPNGGEIDIIEGVNTAQENILSAHTADGCFQSKSLDGLFSGVQRNQECSIGSQNIGCGFNPPAYDTKSYGTGFNAVGGGVYAMLWDSEHIRVWHFPRGGVPDDIEAKDPQPKRWGLPQAIWGSSGCDVDSYFKNMNIVININFCGDYGNAVWGRSDTCNQYADTCSEFVANNPRAFREAYWDIKYIDVYNMAKGGREPSGDRKPDEDYKHHDDHKDGPEKESEEESRRPEEGGRRPQGGRRPNGPLTAPPSEPTTTTTKVFYTTETVVFFPNGTRASPPAPSGKLRTPAKIGEYSHLGCFGSNKGFPGFALAKDAKDMTLERCVSLCGTKGYAATFQGTCYCATALDADSVPQEDELCNRACPGNIKEACGGIIPVSATISNAGKNGKKPQPKRQVFDRIPDNVLLTVYGVVDDEKPTRPKPPPLGHQDHERPQATATIYNEMPHGDWHRGQNYYEETYESSVEYGKTEHHEEHHEEHYEEHHGQHDEHGHSKHHNEHGHHDKGEHHDGHEQSGNHGGKKAHKPFVGTVRYETLPSGHQGKLKEAEYVYTLQECECEDEPTPSCAYEVPVPMHTHVVDCDACGSHGEDKVTLTVPAALPTAKPPPPPTGTPEHPTKQPGKQAPPPPAVIPPPPAVAPPPPAVQPPPAIHEGNKRPETIPQGNNKVHNGWDTNTRPNGTTGHVVTAGSPGAVRVASLTALFALVLMGMIML